MSPIMGRRGRDAPSRDALLEARDIVAVRTSGLRPGGLRCDWGKLDEADQRRAVELVRESALSASALAAAIERAAAREPARVAIDTDGAAKSARLIAAMLRPVDGPGECLVAPSGEAFVAGASQGIIAR